MLAATNRIVHYLDEEQVPFERRRHKRDETAKQAARDCHACASQFAKAIVILADGSQLLAVLPADHRIDLPKLREQVGASQLELLPEEDLTKIFGDCELGAIPALGNLYGLPVYISPELAEQPMIVFHAGTHEDVIEMPYASYERLVSPIVLDFSSERDRTSPPIDQTRSMPTLTNRALDYLDQAGIPYTRLHHRRDITARQTAHDCQLKPSDFAKVVGLETEGRQFLVVLPADHYVDLERVREHLGVDRVNLLPEGCVATFFPDCEIGACPPLGNVYGLPVYVAPAVADRESIAFNAGTHEDVIQMAYSAFDRLVNPTVMDFAVPIDDSSYQKSHRMCTERSDKPEGGRR